MKKRNTGTSCFLNGKKLRIYRFDEQLDSYLLFVYVSDTLMIEGELWKETLLNWSYVSRNHPRITRFTICKILAVESSLNKTRDSYSVGYIYILGVS